MLQLSFTPYTLRLRSVFRISRGARSTAPLMLLRISFDGHEGYGEASMPVLYGESHETAADFLSRVDLSRFNNPFEFETILSYVDTVAPGNKAIKAAIDMALHDLAGKLHKQPVHTLLGLPYVAHHTSMTIGIDTPEKMARKAFEYKDFKYLKIKLGGDQDEEIIRAIREVTAQPFFIDANQGWANKHLALERIHWLNEQNTVFIEQPMPKEQKADNAWLTERSPLPIIGDEAVQRLEDIKEASSIYNGINIKLMKCTGIREGFKMAVAAKALGMKVMLGCMSETSCAISAASQLGALADWIDLDGNLDAANDPFRGNTVEQGRLISSNLPGVGLEEVDWSRLEAAANASIKAQQA